MITSMKSSTVADERWSLDIGKTLPNRIWLTIFVPNKHLTVQHLVVSEDVVEHLFIQVLWGCLECNLHSSGLLRLEIDVPTQY